MKKLGPGIYDNDGELHVEAVEVLMHAGIEPTEENQNYLAAAMRAWAEGEGVPVETKDAGGS